MNRYDVIKRPLDTEKLDRMREKQNAYAFEVDGKATKLEVKAAVQELFKVKVTGVRTMVRSGKLKGRGKMKRRMPDWKRAIVTLKAGDTVEFL